MELVKDMALVFFACAWLSGLLLTALGGSSRVLKIYLVIVAAISSVAAIVAMVISGGLFIFLLFQLISLVLIVLLVILFGAVCGRAIYQWVHRDAGRKFLDSSGMDDYLSVGEFALSEGIAEERVLARISSGYYQGGELNGCWYVHKSEVSR